MIRKILLPTDGSEHAEKVIQLAQEIASLSQASVVVMHAYNPRLSLRKRAALAAEGDRITLQAAATALVAAVSTRLQGAGCTATGLVVEGSPTSAILRAITEEQPDLLVMGTHLSGPLAGLTWSSVAARVVRQSPVPVLVVK